MFSEVLAMALPIFCYGYPHVVIPCYEKVCFFKVSVDALYVFDIVDGWSDLACFRQGLRQKHDGCAAETSRSWLQLERSRGRRYLIVVVAFGECAKEFSVIHGAYLLLIKHSR